MEEHDPLHGVGRLLLNHVNLVSLSILFFHRVSIDFVVVLFESWCFGASAFYPNIVDIGHCCRGGPMLHGLWCWYVSEIEDRLVLWYPTSFFLVQRPSGAVVPCFLLFGSACALLARLGL